VQQAVDAAEIDERAELGDVLDDALADLADLDLAEELLLEGVALVLEEAAAADDDVTPGLVDLEDLALDGAADVVGDVGRAADIDLAGGQEDVDADVDQQAALDLAGDRAGDDVALLVLGDDLFPFLLPLRLALGQDDRAGLVLDGVEEDVDLVADLGGLDAVLALVVPLADGDDAFALVADVHDHVVADDVGDPAADDLVDLEGLALALVVFLEFGGLAGLTVEPRRGHLELKILLGGVELAKQVTIDHIRNASSAGRPPGFGREPRHPTGHAKEKRAWPAPRHTPRFRAGPYNRSL
jgi:hypothetical protein